MNALLLTIALLAQPVPESLNANASAREPGPWRVQMALGVATLPGRSAEWLGLSGAPLVVASAERTLREVAPGLTAFGSLGLAAGADDGVVTGSLYDATAGVGYELPWLVLGHVAPYARAGLTASWLVAAVGEGLGGHTLLPGVTASAGVRVVASGRTARRPYFFIEGGYVARLPREVQVSATADEDELLRQRSVSLGEARLSGVSTTLGAGVTF